jgi:hypothetical protein
MKKVIVIVMALLFGALMYWFMRSASHGGTTVQIAFGHPDAQGMLMNGVVTVSMTLDDQTNPQFDGKWVNDHLELLDSAGARVHLDSSGTCELIIRYVNSDDVGYFAAKLTPGKKYTLCYRPKADGPVRYKGVFLVPDVPQQRTRYILGQVR